MTMIRRLTAVVTLLVMTAAVTSTNVWGDSGRKSQNEPIANGSKTVPADAKRSLGEDLAASKFSTHKVLTYRTRDGETLIALQVQPKLDPVPARPRDYLILVDTSASQVGLPLANACTLTEEILKSVGPNDRCAVWTVNIPAATRDLTGGFQAPKSAAFQKAISSLKREIPLGDTDLAGALEKAARAFQIEPGRQRVIVYLGDGMSVHSPVSATQRAQLCEEMVKNAITFFPVPFGPRLDPQNLHGFATGTGGQVVRVLAGDKARDCLSRLQEAVAVPVLYPTSFQVAGAESAEFFPTHLPPLRSDAATLLIGRIKAGQTLSYTIEGQVADHAVRVQMSDSIAAPELDNFFLVGMFDQWKNAKDQPALMQADRALSYAYELNQFARAEFLAQAHAALANNKLDVATKLFGQAKEVDPTDVEADGGLKVVQMMREGRITREQLRKQLADDHRIGAKLEKVKDGSGHTEIQVRKDRMDRLIAQAQPKPRTEEGVAPPRPGDNVTPAEMLRQQRLAQEVEEQRVTGSVNDAISEARRLLQSDPEGARDLLRRILGSLGEDTLIREEVRDRLTRQLEGTLRFVDTEGARIVRDQQERLRRQAIAVERLALDQARRSDEELIQRRMIAFREMIRTARYEDAYLQALSIAQDQIRKGAPVPVAVTAAADHSQYARNLRDYREVQQLAEERYVTAMLQVEKAHVPFPDEPPIRFPDVATWQQLTRMRKERYESSGIETDDPAMLQRIRYLRDQLGKPITFEFERGPLREAIAYLQDRYNIPIIVDTEAFKEIGTPDVLSTDVQMPKVANISLGTVLRLLLAPLQGTYIIRREFIEITTGTRQAAEKAVRVYPVADLVIPIPNAINQNGVNQTLMNSILGGQGGFSPFGGALNQPFGLGGLGLGALGLGGLGLGGLGLGGLGLGGLGGLGGAGLAGAAGLGGNLGGLAGLGGGGGPQNLGVGGGGFVGFAGFGGQLGQLGNLGGQFGLQGGDQSQILITLIRQVVGNPTEWGQLSVFQRPQVGVGAGLGVAQRDDPAEEAADPATANNLGYYPPARALVVKGTSRIHTRLGGGLLGGRPGAPPPEKGAALDKVKQDFFAKGGEQKNNIQDKLKAAAEKPKDDTQLAKDQPAGKGKGPEIDPEKIWQEALAKGVNDPGLIIAVTDYLIDGNHRVRMDRRFEHVAEFLKANLRLGIVARPWVYECLAIALKESNGSPVEVERAQLSLLDLQPDNPQSYLKASEAMKDARQWDRAVAFCKQASRLAPDSPEPYVEALAYAETAKDTQAMEWAAGNLLSRDWPADNADVHTKAREKLQSLQRALEKANRRDEAERMTRAVESQRHRDLVIQLSWQGEAECDLEVKEPIGSVCSFLQRQTPGGGILVGNTLTDMSREIYTAAQAFSGEYQVTVRRIWGRPLGAKVNVKIIQHQGTPQETVRQETVVLDQTRMLRLSLEGGRRLSVAHVAPANANARPRTELVKEPSGGDIRNKLRALADPEYAPVNTGMVGGMASLGVPMEPRLLDKLPSRLPTEAVAYQTQSASLRNSLDLAAQATVTADGRYVRLSLSPVFQTAARNDSGPLVSNPLIPGAPGTGQ